MDPINRRTFLLSAAMTSTPLLPLSAPQDYFIHHVFFWLKHPQSKEDLARLVKGLETLKKIKEIRMAHIGVTAASDREVVDKSYSLSWMLFFDNAEAEKIYQEHPIHKKFVADCQQLWTRVVVYDSLPYKA
jgi:hypothetical protein